MEFQYIVAPVMIENHPEKAKVKKTVVTAAMLVQTEAGLKMLRFCWGPGWIRKGGKDQNLAGFSWRFKSSSVEVERFNPGGGFYGQKLFLGRFFTFTLQLTHGFFIAFSPQGKTKFLALVPGQPVMVQIKMTGKRCIHVLQRQH